MNLSRTLEECNFILAEAAIVEAVRRSGRVSVHPRLQHALLIYDQIGKTVLSELYNGYIAVALANNIPITISTPTWRANQERLSEAGILSDVNADAVEFLNDVKAPLGSWAQWISVGGLIGCKNDAYSPAEGLSRAAAEKFHSWQIERLAQAGVDFLLAATLPSLDEAAGIALAMEKTVLPYVISFVINKQGRILDGNSLEAGFALIDSSCSRAPLGYMINCAYPTFLNPEAQPQAVLSRLIGYQANASSNDHSDLDGAESLHADDIEDWADRMLELNNRYGVKILGGCCGTSAEHLECLVRKINSDIAGGMTGKTLRQQMIALLEGQVMGARDLSSALSVREKEVYTHLAHVERTVTTDKRRFVVHPSRCIACGFEFKKRKRLTRPSRCPKCKSSRLSQPLFQIL